LLMVMVIAPPSFHVDESEKDIPARQLPDVEEEEVDVVGGVLGVPELLELVE